MQLSLIVASSLSKIAIGKEMTMWKVGKRVGKAEDFWN